MEQGITIGQHVRNLVKEKYKEYNFIIPYEKLIWSDEYIDVELADGSVETVDRLVEFTLAKLHSFYFIDRYCYTNHPKQGYVPFKLFDFQKTALRDFQLHNKVIFRKCLTDKSFVTTKRGFISIKDVIPGDEIQTLKDGKLIWTLVEDAWKNKDLKEVVYIQTNDGAEIECTLDHPIHTQRGWIEAQHLTINDEITSSFGLHPFGDYELEYDEWAALIGYYIADGKGRDPVFVNTNKKYVDEVLAAGHLFDGLDPYIKEIKKEKTHHTQKYHVRLQGHNKSTPNPFNAFKKKYGLDKNSHERHLTPELMQLNKRQMSILLNRLFAGDGWFGCNSRGKYSKTHAYEIGIGSPDYILIKQIQQILLGQYGIYSRIEEQFGGKLQKTKFWKIRINHRESILRFINEIGIYDKTNNNNLISILKEELASGYNNNQRHNKIKKIIKQMFKESYDITTKSSDFLSGIMLVHNCRQMGKLCAPL